MFHLWLMKDGGDGALFLNDLEGMLVAIAGREGIVPGSGASPDLEAQAAGHRFIDLPLPDASALQAEVGLHRAQIVPRTSDIGRVMTSVVAVEFVRAPEPGSSRPTGVPIKTYNYVQRRVTRHPNGTVLPLDDVLSGKI